MKAITNGRPIEILLVEDSSTDVMLTKAALKYAKMRNNLHVVKDGVEAMAFLRKEREYSDVPRPDLILLDLNMPRKDGREALKDIKANADLRRIPIVVLTTSKAEEDILRTYDLGVNSYVTKPVTFGSLVETVRVLGKYWFEIVELPQESEL